MEVSLVSKLTANRALLAPQVMSDRACWDALLLRVRALDPSDPNYTPGYLGQFAVEAEELVLELRKRGTQLPLFDPPAR
jgi:hypothetical protein